MQVEEWRQLTCSAMSDARRRWRRRLLLGGERGPRARRRRRRRERIEGMPKAKNPSPRAVYMYAGRVGSCGLVGLDVMLVTRWALICLWRAVLRMAKSGPLVFRRPGLKR